MTFQTKIETDIHSTSAGDLSISFLGHGSLLMFFNGMNIYVDVFGEVADYSKLPKADIVLFTHEHSDHLDPKALAAVRTDETILVHTKACSKEITGGVEMRNGAVLMVEGILVEAVPAYNLIHTRKDGQLFHPKGIGNGYILNFGDTRVYIAGDTENIPEMKELQDIAIAFLPMNLPYTMTPEMVAEVANAFRPRILYPYHYGNTDVTKLEKLLMKGEKEIELRIRNMV
jgi:L-ascorbate metabolism protein UlaG (beta-lactamase superfamily)